MLGAVDAAALRRALGGATQKKRKYCTLVRRAYLGSLVAWKRILRGFTGTRHTSLSPVYDCD